MFWISSKTDEKTICAVVNELVPSLESISDMNETVRIDAFRDVLKPFWRDFSFVSVRLIRGVNCYLRIGHLLLSSKAMCVAFPS
jgi:hypothetical protein